MIPFNVAFLPLIRNTFDVQLAGEMITAARQFLVSNGFHLIEPSTGIGDLDEARNVVESIQNEQVDLLLFFQATFADSSLVTTIAANCHAPVFLWAVPEPWTGERLRLNSLCGINLAGHALGLQKRRYYFGYGMPEDPKILKKIRTVAASGQVVRRLQNARLGVVGEHPSGFDSCHLDQEGLKNTFGVEIMKIDLPDLFSRARSIEPEKIQTTRSLLDQKLNNLAELEQVPLMGSLAVYNALNDLSADQEIDGLAVRCWPEFFTELGCAACGAMSLISDGFNRNKPVPCSCEADINGTLTQLILFWLSGTPSFGTDIVGVDVEKNQIALWHCGLAPMSMADTNRPVQGGIHSNRKLPLVMDFAMKAGVVTIARISQSGGRLSLMVGRGQMLPETKPFSGTSGVLRLDMNAENFLDTLISQGYEHHISITYGDYVEELKTFAELINLPVILLS